MADRGGRGRPVAPGAGALRPLGTHEVRLEPGFWADRQRLGSEVVAGHCLDWMTRLGPLTLIPYHLWGNRGPASMRVWLPEAR